MRYDNFDKLEMGERIAWLAEKKQWTMKKLASKLNISDGALSMKIKGKRPFTINELLALSDFFDITLDELVIGIETKKVSTHRATGLSKQAISNLRLFSLTNRKKMKALNYALSYPQVLDSIARYISFTPKQKGYYLSERVSEDEKLVYCSMSQAVYKSVLGQNLINMLDEIRSSRQYSKNYMHYEFQDYGYDEYMTDEELIMAESEDEFYEENDEDEEDESELADPSDYDSADGDDEPDDT